VEESHNELPEAQKFDAATGSVTPLVDVDKPPEDVEPG
jgi:hypothetical protein